MVQHNIEPGGKDRGAEQCDVDGPLECSLTLGRVATAARLDVHKRQRCGDLPWASEGKGSSVEDDARLATRD